MNWRLLRQRSLKARVTLGILPIFLASIWSLSIYVGIKLQDDLQRQLSKQQFSTASFLAADADRTLKEHLYSLGRLAGQLGPALLTDATAIKEHLSTRPVLLETFNAGIVVLNADGTLTNSGQGGPKISYMGLESVSAALREGKSTIGGAGIDPVTGTPVFAMSVPIGDDQADIVGALTGIVSLSTRNILDQITESYYGQNGYFLIVSEKNHQIVMGTGKRRIMENLLPETANPLLERFTQGFDETGVTIDAKQEVLASARRIPVAGWYLVAALPSEEAFSAVHEMQFNMLKAALLLSVLAGALTWWILSRELSPMLSAVRTLTDLSTSDRAPQPLPVNRPDEIGELIGGFNGLLETLNRRQEALRESENRFTAFMNTLPAAAFIEDQNGKTVFANRYMTDTVGLRSWPAQAATGTDEGSEADPTRTVREEEIRNAAGETRLFQTHRFAIPYAGYAPLSGGIALDITEHRQMEAQVRLQLLHDPLTGLPNRCLLNDRLEQALASSKRSHCYSAVMFVDLDNFKPLNDTHGHAAGDLLLIEVARRLQQCVREMDTVARFGGDEFVVVVRELSAKADDSRTQSLIIAEKVRVALSLPYSLRINQGERGEASIVHHCSASIGIALFNEHEGSQFDALKRADAAMYEAKEAGRNQLRFDVQMSGDTSRQSPLGEEG